MLLDNFSNLEGVRLLIVDDNSDNLEFLVFLFEQYGAQVRAVSTVNEVLDVFTQWQPEILISDIVMPSMDGYALIRTIRTMPTDLGGQIPAIAVTAHAVETDNQQMVRAAGFQKYMTKPVDPTELVIAVANLVAQNKSN